MGTYATLGPLTGPPTSAYTQSGYIDTNPPLAGWKIGEQLPAWALAKIIPHMDAGSSCDGIVYSGTWDGQNIRPDTSLGDALFPKINPGESDNLCRFKWSMAIESNMFWWICYLAAQPATEGRVKFLIMRTSAGDRLARGVTPIASNF